MPASIVQPIAQNKIDVAINIFAKPLQTSLSILSLLQHSGSHIGKLWLQYEPMGSRFDHFSPYLIYEYLLENKINAEASQPDCWLAREAADASRFADEKYRLSIRYQYAFEHSNAQLLFLMHNDIFVFKDIVGAMLLNMGDSFAIGQLGQCWNCPASKAQIMKNIGCSPCTPQTYANFRPSVGQLSAIYAEARKMGVFARPYDAGNFAGEFSERPWPLPECRINEWACLINLDKTRPLTVPFGNAWPPGAFRLYASHNLDTLTPWFRDMHANGLSATHFNVYEYMKHWIGTGKKSPIRYAKAEDNAGRLLRKHYPEFAKWIKNRTGSSLPA